MVLIFFLAQLDCKINHLLAKCTWFCPVKIHIYQNLNCDLMWN